jgi:hypothetical protein
MNIKIGIIYRKLLNSFIYDYINKLDIDESFYPSSIRKLFLEKYGIQVSNKEIREISIKILEKMSEDEIRTRKSRVSSRKASIKNKNDLVSVKKSEKMILIFIKMFIL